MQISARAAAVVIALAVAGCGESEGSQKMVQFRIGDVAFSVPSQDLRSSREGQSGFIRINDPETAIEIAYDQQLQNKTDELGHPLLFSVNDGNYPDLEYRRTAEGASVVCRVSAAAPTRKCGSPVVFKGSTWTVLFPVARVQEAETFRRRAENLLQNFSTS